MKLEEIEPQLAGETFHPSTSDAYIHGKHYTVLDGDFQPCSLGDECEGWPYCHVGFDFIEFDS